jgi:hypothetical protein
MRYILAVLCLFLLTGSAFAQSQQPTHGTGVAGNNPPQIEPGNTPGHATTDQCGTETSPLVVKVLNPQEETNGFSILNVNVWLVAVTGGLFLVGLYQAWISRDTARRQLRAYLSMHPKVFGGFGTTHVIRIEFLTINHGQTPAFDISHVFNIDIFPWKLPDDFVFPAAIHTVNTSNTVFPKDEDIRVLFNHIRLLTAAEEASVTAGTHKIYVWGVTEYHDAFGNPHKTIFNASVGGAEFAQSQKDYQAGRAGGPWDWEFGPSHNKAT